jgi:1-acyl-sn-glycerol-3-phosphate acyltransferase
MAIHYRDKDDAWVGKDTLLSHFFRQMGKPVTKVDIKFGTPVSDSDYKQIQQQIKHKIDSMLLEIIESKS